jgi:hypothetical protein
MRARIDRRDVIGASRRGDLLSGLSAGASGCLGRLNERPRGDGRIRGMTVIRSVRAMDGTEFETDPAS